jgi:uncharacterized membrane protein YqjE
VNWISLLGLDVWAARSRAALIEAALAAEDRADLARLEWLQHRRSLQTLLIVGVVLGGLTVVVLLALTMAVMVQFWDTEYRTAAGWLLAAGWLVVWGLALWRLAAAARQLSRPFELTRHELMTDWKALKEKL